MAWNIASAPTPRYPGAGGLRNGCAPSRGCVLLDSRIALHAHGVVGAVWRAKAVPRSRDGLLPPAGPAG
jgi:hypothetical protein